MWLFCMQACVNSFNAMNCQYCTVFVISQVFVDGKIYIPNMHFTYVTYVWERLVWYIEGTVEATCIAALVNKFDSNAINN